MAYIDDLQNQDMNLFRRHSLQCPDEPKGFNKSDTLKFFSKWTFTTLEPGQLVSYVSVSPEVIRDKGEVLKMIAHLATDAQDQKIFQRAGYLPAYFLPWDKNGGIVEMTIPDLDPARPKTEYPDLFFTAALSGCSVFVKGPARKPIVQHCGIETGGSSVFNGMSAEEYWRFLSDYVEMSSKLRYNADIAGEANKADYVSGHVLPDGSKTTKNALRFEKMLKKHYAKPGSRPIDVQVVFPWGCVFGLRDALGNWTFYLQENASISYFKKDASGTTIPPLVQASRPMVVREIFPNPAPAARPQTTWRVLPQ